MESWEVHADAIIFDGHNDSLPMRLERGEAADLGPPNEAYQVDLPRWREAGVTAVNVCIGLREVQLSLALWEAMHWNLERYPSALVLARTASDIRRAKGEGRTALVPQIESCACLGEDLSVLQLFRRLGLRVVNLSHGEGKDVAEGAVQTDSSQFGYVSAEAREQARTQLRGLTAFGREVVQACNDLGLVVDLAHANDRTFYEAVELSRQPCIFSHGCVFAVCNHWRGLTDRQIQVLAEAGGVLAVAFYGKFIHPSDPTMARLLDQVEHVIDLVGPDHVGFGSDFDGLPPEAVVIPAHQGRLVEFTEALLTRFDEMTVRKVLGENLLRVFAEVCGE